MTILTNQSGYEAPAAAPGALRVVIIASGRVYQEAAAWSAPTYVQSGTSALEVAVAVPSREQIAPVLREHAARYGFTITRFPFRAVSEHKYTSQLKCAGFYHALSRLAPDALLLLVDADTYCLKPLTLATADRAAVAGGQVGLAPDLEDRHSESPNAPWYLAPRERTTYVNSGVILAARRACGIARRFRELSTQRRFLRGPFNDQKVINFALGRHFPGRLHVLDRKFNGILHRLTGRTIIGHCAGGAGRLEVQARREEHRTICEEILRRRWGGCGAAVESGASRRGSRAHPARSPEVASRKYFGDYLAAFARAVTNGRMGPGQYRYIAQAVRAGQPGSLLVIGAGYDSALWYCCAEGRAAFVEDDPRFLPLIPAHRVRFQFESRVGCWSNVPIPPRKVARLWDFVIIDGPHGFGPQCPGRQIPVAWAARLARRKVFVHDYDRP